MNKINLKLDFNERADSQPQWLKSFQLNVNNLWRYPDRKVLENQMASDMGLLSGSVMLSNGGDESIELLYKNCKLNNQSLLVPEPCFSQYSHNQMVWQNDTVFTAACDDLSIDVETLKANLTPNQWLILTRPNNPTGEYLSAKVLVDLIQAAAAKGAWVFLDEAYVEFANENDPIDYKVYSNLITLRTFSKAFGLAGARIGYIFGQPELIAEFRKLAMPFNLSRANLQLATAAWQARDEIKAYCETIAANRDQVAQLLIANDLAPCPSRGNFLLFETTAEKKVLFTRVMAKFGIQIKTELAGLPRAVRLTIPENTALFTQALQLILDPQLLAFDMDGVLIDTSQSYDQCIMGTLHEFTGHNVTQDDIEAVRARGGFNNDWVLAAEMIKNQGVTVRYDQVVKTFQRLYLGDGVTAGLITQEQNLLSAPLKNQLFNSSNQFKTAIVTGRPRAEAVQGVGQLKIRPDFIISADDVSQQKPDPEGLLSIMQASQTKPDHIKRTWFCGDTVDDMQAGTQAGCVCIGIITSTKSTRENGVQRQAEPVGERSESEVRAHNTNNSCAAGFHPQDERREARNLLYQAGADVVLENINQLETLL